MRAKLTLHILSVLLDIEHFPSSCAYPQEGYNKHMTGFGCHKELGATQVTVCVWGICRYKNGDRGQTYNFSRVFGDDTGQEQFFQASAQPMVRQLMRTQTSSVMIAYGTSAAGKTYTIEVRQEFPVLAPYKTCHPLSDIEVVVSTLCF